MQAARAMEPVATVPVPELLDLRGFASFRQLYNPWVGNAAVDTIELDMSAVQNVTGTGLGMMRLLCDKAASTGQRVAIVNCKSHVKNLLETAAFEQLCDIA